jgi:predicted small secreted protein
MKKLFPAIILAAALTLSACGTAKTDSGTGSDNKNNETKTSESKSLKDLLGLGTSQKCTFESKTEDTAVKSEIIMNGKKFRQTSEITTKEGKMKVYAVSDGIYYYSWSDTAKDMGTKMKIEDVENEGKNISNENKEGPVEMEGQQQISMDEKIDYKCTPATLTDADLAIPTDIKFLDYADMMKGFENMNLEELQKMAPQE